VADKNFLSWVGFKGEEEGANKPNLTAGSASLDRIRELESQLNDLRSRRDITSLSKEEFEILATETAMSIIRTAQQREAKANANAERVLNESKKHILKRLKAMLLTLSLKQNPKLKIYSTPRSVKEAPSLPMQNAKLNVLFSPRRLKYLNIETGFRASSQKQSVCIASKPNLLMRQKMRSHNHVKDLRAPLIV